MCPKICKKAACLVLGMKDHTYRNSVIYCLTVYSIRKLKNKAIKLYKYFQCNSANVLMKQVLGADGHNLPIQALFAIKKIKCNQELTTMYSICNPWPDDCIQVGQSVLSLNLTLSLSLSLTLSIIPNCIHPNLHVPFRLSHANVAVAKCVPKCFLCANQSLSS